MKVYDYINESGTVRALLLIEPQDLDLAEKDSPDNIMENAMLNAVMSLSLEKGVRLMFPSVLSFDEQEDGAVMISLEAAVKPDVKLGQYRDIPVDTGLGEEKRTEYLLKTAAEGIEAEVPGLIVEKELDTLRRDKMAEVLQNVQINILTDIHRILEEAIREITPSYSKEELWQHAIRTTETYFRGDAPEMTADTMISAVLDVLSRFGKVTDDSGKIDEELCSRISVIIESRGKERARLTGESLAEQVFDTWLRTTNQTVEQWMESARPQALENTRINLLLDAVAEQETLAVTDEEVRGRIDEYAAEYEITPAEVRQFISEDAVRHDMLRELARQFILDSAILL